MKGFLTPDGFYYEADTALAPADLSVPLRPDGAYRYDLHKEVWVADRTTLHHPVPHWSLHQHPHHEEGYVNLTDLKLNLKDVIQASFAIVGLVSIFFTVKAELYDVTRNVEALRKSVEIYEQHLAQHDASETAHWRQMQEMRKRISDLENELAYSRRSTNRNP